MIDPYEQSLANAFDEARFNATVMRNVAIIAEQQEAIDDSRPLFELLRQRVEVARLLDKINASIAAYDKTTQEEQQ